MTRSEELTAKILEMATQLDRVGTTTTDGLDEAQLGKLADALQADVDAAAAATTPAGKKTAAKAADSAYVVTVGNAITSLRGIIDAGEEVLAEHVCGGVDTLENLVKSGHLSKSAKS